VNARSLAALVLSVTAVCAATGAGLWNHFDRAPSPALEVKAVAHQWWWEFDYPSLGVKSTEALHVPSNQHVDLKLESADVVHSFWMLGMKNSVSVIPGRTRTIDLDLTSPGELYGNCDAGCGCGTVCMRFQVLASAPAEFERWAAQQRAHPSEFKPPHATSTPACALATGLDGHHTPTTAASSPASRLQQILDGNSSPNAERPLKAAQ